VPNRIWQPHPSEVFPGGEGRQVPAITLAGQICCEWDGSLAALETPAPTGILSIPFNLTLTGWVLLADQAGSAVVDVWRSTYANYPPEAGDSICAATRPTLGGEIKQQNLLLTNWQKQMLAGDTLWFVLDSVATIEWLGLYLQFTRDQV